jgi:hypothetical protein
MTTEEVIGAPATCSAVYPLVIEGLKAIPSFALAAIVAFISFRQWAVARAKLRLDLYDRRYKVYEAVKDLHTAFLESEGLTNACVVNFLNRTSDVDFLFDDDVVHYIDKTRRHAQQYLFCVSRMSQLHNDGRRDSDEFHKVSGEFQQHLKWLSDEVGNAKKPFFAYLSFKKVKDAGPGASTRH